jgi:hypothetical protein
MNSPDKYKTGKPRLGSLRLDQLEKMLADSSSPKTKAKIRNRIAIVQSRQKHASAS